MNIFDRQPLYFKSNQCFSCLIICVFLSFILTPSYASIFKKTTNNNITNCTAATTTSEGPIQGSLSTIKNDRSACVFKGIPYAAPPLGDLRWKKPQAPKVRDNLFMADTFIDDCMQDRATAGLMVKSDAEGMSENCLGLNIWRPTAPGNYPVMVWFHGGGFILGSGSWPTYNGTSLADQQNVVVVTVNYRLNVFGFLAHSDLVDLDDGFDGGTSGNYGFMDQQAALQWVQNNIQYFSGDRNNVTIFGESAGGWSVATHLISPSSQHLFHKAILQSGGYDATINNNNAFEVGNRLATNVGCLDGDIASCLKQKSADDIYSNANTGDSNCASYTVMNIDRCYFPREDGVIIPNTPFQLIKNGEYKKVPTLGGYTGGDLDFLTTSMNAGFEAMNGHSQYLYNFQYKNYALDFFVSGIHGAEIEYVFDTMKETKRVYGFIPQYTRRQMHNAQTFVDQVQSYWGNFALTGNPNGHDINNKVLPYWPDYHEGTGKNYLALENNISNKQLDD